MARPAPAATCELHGLPLEAGTATILYGLPDRRWLAERREAAEARFPHASSFVLGGCIVSDDAPRTRNVRFCPACRAASAEWAAARAARKTS
jgi:hypothetical protein